MTDHGLAKELENSFSSSSSSSSEESDEDMEGLRAWIVVSKSMSDNEVDSSYRHDAEVEMTPSQSAIMSNHPVIEVNQESKLYRPVVVLTKLVFKSGQTVAATNKKPLKSHSKAARGKFVCDLCLDDGFKKRGALWVHKKNLHGKSPMFLILKLQWKNYLQIWAVSSCAPSAQLDTNLSKLWKLISHSNISTKASANANVRSSLKHESKVMLLALTKSSNSRSECLTIGRSLFSKINFSHGT